MSKDKNRLHCINKHRVKEPSAGALSSWRGEPSAPGEPSAGKHFLDDEQLIKKIISSSHLSCDSREIKNGSSFIAIKGENCDGHDFIPGLKSIDCLIFAETSYRDKLRAEGGGENVILVKNTQAFANEYAAVFFRHPSREMKIIGITGTNGKTTSSYYLASFYRALGAKTGLIGTIETRYGDVSRPNPNTTPEPVRLQRSLREMKDAGVEVVIMEISSHALSLGRVTGLCLDSVLFTNLTQDHLDFHGDLQSYLKAKLLIFDLLARSTKENKQAIFWRDSMFAPDIRKYLGELSLNYSTYFLREKEPGDPKGKLTRPAMDRDELDKQAVYVMEARVDGLRLGHIDCRLYLSSLDSPWAEGSFPLIGEYNVLNLLGCLGELIASGSYVELSKDNRYKDVGAFVIDCLEKTRVPGRMEVIENDKGALIVVDYAHTPDALENVIGSLRRLPHKKLITLFGCGGDRDNSKRAKMGRAAGQGSDFVHITSDNPRTEEPMAILEMIRPGVKATGVGYEVTPDREEAIKRAVQNVGRDEILLIAGKGHENYQILGREKIHFDDREMVRKYK